jgi:dimethylhistidine N-methyltransferase
MTIKVNNTSTLNLSNSPNLNGFSVEKNVKLYNFHPPEDDFRAEVIQGLSKSHKTISPKFLYDKKGAELFDAICTLDEYYITRTERAILQTYAQEIAKLIGDGVLVEFGSGSSQKVRIILDATPQLRTYIALDISHQHLYESCTNLVEDYPQLEAIAICADYTQPLQLPDIPSLHNKYKVGFFPGSSIGNLEPKASLKFLRNTVNLLQCNGSFIVGVDLKKSKDILEPAYDDSEGVSAAFALNLLTRINRELGADFDHTNFTYQAIYNPIGRIEMSLVSLREQVVHIDDTKIKFEKGEKLYTEHSYKYTINEFQALAARAGFKGECVWTDPEELFSLHYLKVI